MKKRRTILILGTLAITPLFAEIVVRISGISNFPIYHANSDIGYIPAPSQSGDFLRTNHWQFNSKSMAGSEFNPSNAVDTLLIGDSIVYGGNAYKEKDRLGPQLERILGNAVWPISAGSWALRNEVKYLKLHPEVVSSIDQFVFVSNNGDFGEASSWFCEKTHPRSHPIWATRYVFKKYVYDWGDCGEVPKDLVFPKGDWRPELRDFFASENARNKPITFFLYPDKEEVEGRKNLAGLEAHANDILALGKAVKANITIFSIARDARWKLNYYKDDIHPTVDGIRILAEIMANPAKETEIVK